MKNLVLIALMSAVICVLAPISIVLPVSPVPISLSSFAIYLTVIILGNKKGLVSVLIYILLGFVGVPVFSGFTGGVAKVFGPTGGYIIGYIFLAFVMGLFVDKYDKKKYIFLGMVLGTLILYLIGTIWLAFVTGMTFEKALFAGVIPFIPGDIVKMIIALIAGSKIKQSLSKMGLV